MIPASNAPVKAVVYARYSTKMQNDSSIEDQERRCKAYADREGWVVLGSPYADRAQSGATAEREGLQRLLADATHSKPEFRYVLVDDMSRLSRDLGDAWNIIFVRLAKARVYVVDVKQNARSDDPNARFMFGATALFADAMLQMIKSQTHRGLEGRALAGFWTGGRIFGYETVAEGNENGVRRAPRRLRPKATEVEVVRRIFEQYAAGMSLGKIAERLNAEGVASPHASTLRSNNRTGWAFTTIRTMLRNRVYVGEIIWNKKQYVRDPITRNRTWLPRDEKEWKRRSVDELRVIDDKLWSEVQERLERRAGGRTGRPPGTGKVAYVLSGILKCATCGGPMSIIGAKVKNGRRYPSFGCSVNRSKGSAICANNLTVSDQKVTTAVLASISDALSSPEAVSHFTQRFEELFMRRVGDSGQSAELATLDRRIAEMQAQAKRLANHVRFGEQTSETILSELLDVESGLRELRDQRAAAARRAVPQANMPDASVVHGYLKDLKTTLSADPVRANAVLARHVGHITMTPKQKGPEKRWYRASGAFDLSLNLPAVLGKCGCGARI